MSVTARAVVFTVAVCVFLVAMDGWQSWGARTEQIYAMERDSSNLAKAAAEHGDQTLSMADAVIVGIVERVQYDGVGPKALVRLDRVLRLRRAELPELSGLFVYDRRGNWIASSLPHIPSDQNNSDREYFIYHQSHADPGPHIGMMVKSRSSGKWIVPVSRRISDPSGRFVGVVLATIDADYFSRFYDSLDIGKSGAIAMILDRGVMLVRRPFSDVFVNKNMTGTSLLRTYQSQGPEASFFTPSSQDGVNRLNSVRKLEDFPVFVAVALSKDERLASWQRETIMRTTGVVFLVAIVSFFGFGLIQQIARRARVQAELLSTRDALTRANQTLERIAMQDELTQLANRRHFDIALTNETSRAIRSGSTLALIMVDIDLFKQFNDRYGHAEGDECLRIVSRALRIAMPGRPGDLLARYGGEEMAVLLPDTDENSAAAVAEGLRLGVERLQIRHEESPFGVVTLSAGVYSAVPVWAAHSMDHVRAADRALYRAKATGRNRICVQRGRDDD